MALGEGVTAACAGAVTTSDPAERQGEHRTGGLAVLLRASSQGDVDAFGQLYDALCARVYGLVLSIVGDTGPTEEVSRDAFVEVWRTAARFDEEGGNAVGWVMAIAHRQAVDWVRFAQDEHAPAPTGSSATWGAWTSGRIHGAVAAGSADAARVQTAFLSLAHDDRTVLELAYLRGMSQPQLASALGVSTGTARAWVTNGLARLRTALDASDG